MDSELTNRVKENKQTFVLEDNSVVRIYEKQDDFTENDIKYAAGYMSEADPEHKGYYANWSLKSKGISGSYSVRWNPMVVKVFRRLMK
ncbi:MAG: hypothetical protein IJS39_16295 [Synergistaceae bacterium]|nr:hypothetical protein [Synergistaceae bacterium]